MESDAVTDSGAHCRPADDSAAAAAALLGPFLERMVGVSYIKASERESHHVQCSLSHQFDAWIHIDTTTAVVFRPVPLFPFFFFFPDREV